MKAYVLLLLLVSLGIKCEAQTPRKEAYKEFQFTKKCEDIIREDEWPGRDTVEQAEELIAFMGGVQGKRVVDIGCASGYYTFRFAKHGANVLGLDIDANAIACIKYRAEKDGITNFEARQVPKDNPQLQAQEADVIFLAYTAHHLTNRVAYYQKLFGALKKGGRLVIVEYYKPHKRPGLLLSIDQCINELRSAGFEECKVEVNLLKGRYIIISERTQ